MSTYEDIKKQKAGLLKCQKDHIETCCDCDDNFRCTLQMQHIEFEEAQQQEIEQLKQNLKIQETLTMREMAKVESLTADKDEQAGRIMELDNGLKKLRTSFQWLSETIRDLDYKAWAEDKIDAINALLGGKEDV